MVLNIGKLQKGIEESKFTKVEIASKCGIDRKTIENVLAGRDPKLSTVVSLASFLGLKISYLFDEPISSDDHSAKASGHGTIATALDARGDSMLTEKIQLLETLLSEKDERIAEKNERIAELKERINELKTRC
ncbi:MAG: helix-turn-helix domain-containing protein [Bacteroides sp.]|nr:helix-turn-helix domain-containing protein [Bacteroides sp.]